jgi:copper chaperone CopZ
MKANKFVVKGLTDSTKMDEIRTSLHTHEGINAVRVDTKANTITVDYDEARYSEGDIMNFVNQTGVEVTQVK